MSKEMNWNKLNNSASDQDKVDAYDLMCKLFKLQESETSPFDKVTILYEEYTRAIIRDQLRSNSYTV